MKKSKFALLSLFLSIAFPAHSWADYPNVKLGVLTDLSGPYADWSGSGSVIAAQMAVDDCMKNECKGMNVEVLSADMLNKADVASNIAHDWFEKKDVDALVDIPNSSVALAVQKIVKEKEKVALYNGAAVTRLTNEECTPGGIQWMYDTHSLSSGTAKALTTPGKSWFFVTADYVFGDSIQKRSTAVVEQNGGKVLGSVKHPLGAKDFTSYLQQARDSKADVISLANGGADTVNSIKQAKQMGITQTLAPTLLFLTDVKSIGLETAQGLTLTNGFYWDYDNETRAWSKRFEALAHKMPSMVQAGVYSSTLHYLKSVAITKSTKMKTVVEKMRSLPIHDGLMKNAKLLSNGRMVHDLFVFKVKSPSESKYPWDFYKLVKVFKGKDAFMPLAESTCATK